MRQMQRGRNSGIKLSPVRPSKRQRLHVARVLDSLKETSELCRGEDATAQCLQLRAAALHDVVCDAQSDVFVHVEFAHGDSHALVVPVGQVGTEVECGGSEIGVGHSENVVDGVAELGRIAKQAEVLQIRIDASARNELEHERVQRLDAAHQAHFQRSLCDQLSGLAKLIWSGAGRREKIAAGVGIIASEQAARRSEELPRRA